MRNLKGVRSFVLAWLVTAGIGTGHAQPAGPECVVPAKAGGGFDYSCELVQAMLYGVRPPSEAPTRISYLPGGIGAVASTCPCSLSRSRAGPWIHSSRETARYRAMALALKLRVSEAR